jgi:hypothetical protein
LLSELRFEMVGRPEKYYDLKQYFRAKAIELRDAGGQEPFLKHFKEIERESGARLPPSAYKHRAWWANSWNKPWYDAELRTEDVDMENKTLKFRYSGTASRKGKLAQLEKLKRQPEHPFPIFERARQRQMEQLGKELSEAPEADSNSGMADARRAYASTSEASKAEEHCRHPIYGALKGHIRLVAGTDLTEPADPKWGERIWGDDSK